MTSTALARRMAGPQRHRLLRGYPALPLMRQAAPLRGARRHLNGALPGSEPPFVDIDPTRTLIVGVIPHTFCQPKVAGCGFCTFGQNQYRRMGMTHAMAALSVEIERSLDE